MRPVVIEMAGFGTFADPVTIDLDGVDVFALVGPTGAGKSTVVDAICFALYGSIPRYDDRRAVGPALHALANEAKVSLTFDLGGVRYVAARVVRRDAKGRASTRDARLEVLGGEVQAGTAREMDAKVPELLGLDFDQFTRAVVLPQGDFARFLHDKPAVRQDLLVQLLGLDVYERMMQRARAIAAETRTALARDRERLDELASATPEARRQLEDRAGACATARTEWQAARAEIDAFATVAREADEQARRARERVVRLGSVVVPDGVAELAATVTRNQIRLDDATAAYDAASAAGDAAAAALAAAGDRDALARARETHERRAVVAAEVVEVRSAAARAATAAERAREAATRAEQHLEELRTASAVFVVRGHLAAGAPCPVCEQVVAAVPAGEAPEAWMGARDATALARRTAEAAEADCAKAVARVEERDSELARIDALLADAPAPARVAELLDAMEVLVAREKAARADERVARDAMRTAAQAVEAASAGERGAREAYRGARDALAALGLTPPAERDDLAGDWDALVTWAAATAPDHEATATAAATRATTAGEQLAERLGTIAAAAVALELVVGPDAELDDLVAAAGHEEGAAREQVKRLDAEIEERAGLAAAIARRAGEGEVAGELARLLDASHFERWLVSEALARLVAGGSERFHDLSDGRYSFAVDESGRDLLVVDHGQGDERRSVRTLSGGETFQASLALALALSDQLADLAADGASRLESIFLDEGFGTLDAETLETVAATIENLGASDRMVGIVTHVPELAARMPVQFRVSRHGQSSRVERVDS